MKLHRPIFAVALFGLFLTAFAATGTIDPNNTGDYKAQVENSSLGAATTINFGKFTTQSSKNITITDDELTGYAWGDGVGWIVMNCSDTTSGCSGTNGNFKVENDGSGNLSGYAWGENTGWINFGPFTNPAISTVKIENGEFGGTLGSAGYAWAQNYGWIKFDCSDADSCVKTDWSEVTYECDDGIDNDGNGDIDYPDDEGCSSPTDDSEETSGGGVDPICDDGIDNDSDGLTDFPDDPGCGSAIDPDETNILPISTQCNDGKDNDADGLIDYLQDPQCDSYSDDSESFVPAIPPACDDGIDNDFDGNIDLQDIGCENALDNNESNVPLDYCDENPSDLQCFCPLNPTDPQCITPDFCDINPTDPSCIQQEFCDEYPNDSSCVSDNENFCDQYPTDPNCIAPDTYCQDYPELCFPPGSDTELEIITSNVAEAIKDIATSTTGDIIKVVGVTATGVAAAASFIMANPFSIYDIFLSISRLWSLFLVFFGLKKKSKPWGTVYDSVTKQPIDPAYVVLMDLNGNEVATSITDIEGRYGFSVPKGTYTIVANKTNYEFPSKKLAGKAEDELYGDLYFGGAITVTEEGGIIAKNIPLDQLNFDWNEYAKNEQHRLRMYDRRDLLIARISRAAFIAGFIITVIAFYISPTVFNGVITGLYVLMALARVFGFQIKPKGSVIDNVTEQPLPFSIVRVSSVVTNKEVLHKVADNRGKYYILLPNGEYKVVIDRKNMDQSYTPHAITDPVDVKKGYLKKEFKV